jgi:hypothetical protein
MGTDVAAVYLLVLPGTSGQQESARTAHWEVDSHDSNTSGLREVS